MNEEKFKLWKLALSTIHIDGKISPEEKAWFHEKLQTLGRIKAINFSTEQISELEKVLEQPTKNFIEDFKALKNPADCSFLVHIVRVISNCDKEFSDEEKSLVKSLNDAALENVDVAAVTKLVEEMEKESYHEKEVYKVWNTHSFFEQIHRAFQKWINPGDYKFPE